jgi:glycine cleavage system H protein
MIGESSDGDSKLTFMMGEFEAEFPVDRRYARNHMWAQVSDDDPSQLRFGFTAYAVRLLQDVYFLDWMLDAPAPLSESQEIGSIESKKAESALYAPGAGQLIQFNDTLMEDPSAINTDKYGAGWLFEMQISGPEFLNAAQYIELLVDVWAKTQRTIKGQLNE